jgi:hypothetical protein
VSAPALFAGFFTGYQASGFSPPGTPSYPRLFRRYNDRKQCKWVFPRRLSVGPGDPPGPSGPSPLKFFSISAPGWRCQARRYREPNTPADVASAYACLSCHSWPDSPRSKLAHRYSQLKPAELARLQAGSRGPSPQNPHNLLKDMVLLAGIEPMTSPLTRGGQTMDRGLVLRLECVITTGRRNRGADIISLDASRHLHKSLPQASGGFEDPIFIHLPA